jgi:hypothetical protein
MLLSLWNQSRCSRVLPSLHGVLGVSSPASQVLRDAPTPCLRPAALRHLHGAVPRWARSSLPGEGSPPAWVLGLVTRVPTGSMTRRGQGLPGSWASPMRACPAPGPRWNLRVWPRSRRVDAVFRCCDGVDFHGAQLSGLTHAACALPVYASQRRLPDHHATLGSGWWPAFAGRDWRPAGTLRGFPSFAIRSSLPPSPGFAWRNTTSGHTSLARSYVARAGEQPVATRLVRRVSASVATGRR